MTREDQWPSNASPAGPTDAVGPIGVLFVCTANICRSAFAEVVARYVAGRDAGVAFASAGTYGLPAHPISPDIAAFLPAGAEADGFTSRQVTRSMVDQADIVLAMEAVHRTYLLEVYPAPFRKVLTLGQFADAAFQARMCGRALIAEVARTRPPGRPEHDVADPYRRGRRANEAAAAKITSLLGLIVPALVERG